MLPEQPEHRALADHVLGGNLTSRSARLVVKDDLGHRLGVQARRELVDVQLVHLSTAFTHRTETFLQVRQLMTCRG